MLPAYCCCCPPAGAAASSFGTNFLGRGRRFMRFPFFLSRPTNYLHGRFSLPNRCSFNMCRVSHLLAHLGWVDFDSRAPPSCPAVQPLLPNSQQPGQNWADSGTLQIQVSQTQVNELMGRPVPTSLHCSSSEEADDPRPEGPPPPLQAGALQGRGRGRRHVQDERG